MTPPHPARGAQAAGWRGPLERAGRWVALTLTGIWNGYWLLVLAWWVVSTGLVANDWAYIAGVDPQSPYANRVFRWSVPAAWLWAVVVVPLGPLLWGTLHLVALATIRNLGVVLLAVVTYPFWWDVANGNVLTFAFVLGWHALAGRRVGVIGYALFAALVPRPLMIPVLAWLLVRYPSARWAFAAGIVTVVGSAVAGGQLGPWLERLAGITGGEIAAVYNTGPSAVLGPAWVPIGIALGTLAWWRGRLGLASLLVSPYLIHYYGIFALLELAGVRRPVGPMDDPPRPRDDGVGPDGRGRGILAA